MSKTILNAPENLDPEQAGEYLGVSPKTLAVWRCTKRYPIPFIKVGRLVKYRRRDLDAFLEARLVDVAAQ